MSLAIAVDNRVARGRAHDRAAEQVLGRDTPAHRPDFLRAGAFRDLHAFVERRVPKSDRILIEGVVDAHEREAKLVLLGREVDPVLEFRQSLADRRDPAEAACFAFEEFIELFADQMWTHIGDAAKVRGLLRRTRIPEGASERGLAAGLGVTVVRHELVAERAQVILQVFVEDG